VSVPKSPPAKPGGEELTKERMQLVTDPLVKVAVTHDAPLHYQALRDEKSLLEPLSGSAKLQHGEIRGNSVSHRQN